jgi:hypothetical protein
MPSAASSSTRSRARATATPSASSCPTTSRAASLRPRTARRTSPSARPSRTPGSRFVGQGVGRAALLRVPGGRGEVQGRRQREGARVGQRPANLDHPQLHGLRARGGPGPEDEERSSRSPVAQAHRRSGRQEDHSVEAHASPAGLLGCGVRPDHLAEAVRSPRVVRRSGQGRVARPPTRRSCSLGSLPWTLPRSASRTTPSGPPLPLAV